MLINEARTRVHASLESVLDYLADPRRLPDYSEKARTIELLEDSPERVRVSGQLGPQLFTTEFVIIREPACGFIYERVAGGGPFQRGQFHVGLEDGFTMLTHREEWLFERSWTERFWRPRLVAMAEREADRIKQVVEGALIHGLLHGVPLPGEPDVPIVTITRVVEVDDHVPH